jgi:hypothetical protein
MVCKLCENKAVSDGLCATHYRESKYEEWLDNTDENNLGIVKWCHELLPEFAYNDTPWFHKMLFNDLLHLYNPEYRNKYERLYGLISFRESAKSTAANTLFISYILANNGRKFKIKVDKEVKEFLIDERTIVIISQTATSAEDFTSRIRDAFSGNEKLRYFYRSHIIDAIDSMTGQWTRSAFKINNCWVQGVGSGQMIRGKVKGASRPTLVIADDIYSESTVITEESRARTRAWWNNAVMNSIDNLRGKVVVLGTILHDDTILVDIQNNPQWKTRKIQVMPIDKFHEFIAQHLKVNWDSATCHLPFDDESDKDLRQRKQRVYFDAIQKQQDWGLSWPARIDLYFMAIKYQEAVYNQTVSGLYQEYFHITTSPQERKFKKSFFRSLQPWELKHAHGYNWIRVTGGDYQIVNIEFGVDIAGKGKDDAVITVIASTTDNRVYVLHQSIGKYSIRDSVGLQYDNAHRYDRVLTDRGVVESVGLVDETFRLALKYHPSKIKVGIAAEEELIFDEMVRVFQENRVYTINLMKRPQVGGKEAMRKEDRIRNTLLPYYETRMVYHDPSLAKLEYQLEYLGKSTHDDCADSNECAFFQLDFPSDINLSFFEGSATSSSLYPNQAYKRVVPWDPSYREPNSNYFRENWRWL